MNPWVKQILGGLVRRLPCALAAGLLAMTAGAACAQDAFPGKQPVELVVIFPAGSSADVSARILAEGIAQDLGVAVPVTNKPGAGGAIGYKYVAGTKPDGHALVWNSNSVSTTFHGGMMDIDYKAFDPVARVTIEIPAVVVQASSPWKTLQDLIDYARTHPETLKVGNSGVGSHTHMAAVSLFDATGTSALHVPFGAAQVVTSLLGGHIDVAVQLPGAVVPHVKSGALRVLAVLGSKRDPVFPNVPTAQEQDVDVAPMDLWRGVAVAKGTPKATIVRLENAVEAALNRPEFVAAGQKFGFLPAFLPADEFGELIASEDAALAKLMQAIGLKKQP
jgi:tripartite-type tricarboxylate transporter receptor subunit TctC